MLRNTSLIGFGMNKRVISKSLTDSAVDSTDTTAYTFAGKSIGAADSNRRIIIAVAGSSVTAGRTISSVTVGGLTATGDVTATSTGFGTNISALYRVVVPTGTTADVVVTFSGSMRHCGISVYRLINAGAVFNTATDITIGGSNDLSASINIPGGGCAIGSVIGNGSAAVRTWTWTNLTEDVDATIEGATSYTTASDVFTGAQTSRTVTATASGALSADTGALAIVSYNSS